MIPDPSYPTYEAANRAMQMSDAFVQQARMQAQMQMYQQQAAFTGGAGGGQPGIMAYAAGAGQRFMGGMASGISGQMSQFLGGLGTAAGVGAVMAQPMFGQAGNVLEGSRYTGAGAKESFTSLLATAYAPLSLFPQVGTAFGMDQGLRRQMAKEEVGRRATQAGRGAAVAGLDMASLGLGSYLMRRSGSDVAYLGEQERERDVQARLGFLRGAEFGGAGGLGVGRGYQTRGAGRALMAEIREGERGLQHDFGLSREQMGTLRGAALGAVDVTRIQEGAAGGTSGMTRLGREIRGIERAFSDMARTMQLSEKELEGYTTALKGVTQVTASGARTFIEETRRAAAAGPFSAAQVGQFKIQAMGFGQQMFMNAPGVATDAMRQAQRVSEQRQTGAIRADTLIREGGGLDPENMMRMTMARTQQQAGLVQGGNFNQALLLASQRPGAFGAMMGGGAGFFQTQGASAAAMIANPWAMLQARMDPVAAQRVTMAAPAIAFVQSQQREAFMVGNEEAKRVQKIAAFGRQMGMDMNTSQGATNARIRYEELEESQSLIRDKLNGKGFEEAMPSRANAEETAKDRDKMSRLLLGFASQTGASEDQAINALKAVNNDVDLNRRWSGATSSKDKNEILEEGLALSRAGELKQASHFAARSVGDRLKTVINSGGLGATFREAAKTMEAAGESNERISTILFGDARDTVNKSQYMGGMWYGSERRMERVMYAGGGKFQTVRRTLNLDKAKREQIVEKHRKKYGKEATEGSALATWMAGEEKAGRTPWDEEIVDKKWTDEDVRLAQEGRKAGRFDTDVGVTLEDEIRQRGEIRWQDAKGASASTVGILAAAGVSTAGTWEDTAAGIVAGFSDKVKNDRRLAPLLKLSEQTDSRTFKIANLEQAADMRTLRSYFKHWAVKGGQDVMAGIDVSKMTIDEMKSAQSQMSDEQQKQLHHSLALSAFEKSGRTMTKEDMGSFNTPMWVLNRDDDKYKKVAGN